MLLQRLTLELAALIIFDFFLISYRSLASRGFGPWPVSFRLSFRSFNSLPGLKHEEVPEPNIRFFDLGAFSPARI